MLLRLLPAALAAACLAFAAPALAQSPPDWPAPPVAPCPDGFECGRLAVPLDRAQPGSGTTHVAYALLRHSSPGPAAGTIVPNPGGPGEATIAQAAEWRRAIGGRVLADRDLLLIDTRGTGASDELSCDRPGDVLLPGVALPAIARVCLERLGPAPVGAYGSAAVADDFDAVRAHLGVERVDLYGISYGTYLFTVYARRHPERVSSLLLSGAYAPGFDPWARDRARALRRGFERVCARSRACDGRVAVRQLGRLAGRLDRRPLRYRAEVGGAERTLRLDQDGLAQLAYAVADEPALYLVLPRVARAALHGDQRPLRRLARQAAESLPSLEAARGRFSIAATLATSCHDYPRPFDPAAPPAERRAQYRRARRALHAREFAPFGPEPWIRAVREGGDLCLDWPAPTGAGPLEGGPLPDVPVLIANGDLDVNTPLSSARELARSFPRAELLAVPNVGHTPEADPTGCAMRVLRRFLRTHETRRAACLRRIPPPGLA